jgi:hypothetical protein
VRGKLGEEIMKLLKHVKKLGGPCLFCNERKDESGIDIENTSSYMHIAICDTCLIRLLDGLLMLKIKEAW